MTFKKIEISILGDFLNIKDPFMNFCCCCYCSSVYSPTHSFIQLSDQ